MLCTLAAESPLPCAFTRVGDVSDIACRLGSPCQGSETATGCARILRPSPTAPNPPGRVSLVTTTQTSAPRRGRRLLAGVSALVLPALLSGCAIFSPMATENVYNPGDGVGLEFGDVLVRDMIVIGDSQDGPATVAAYVVNTSMEDVTVSFTAAGGSSATVDVPAGTSTQISPPGESGVQLDSMGVPPGAMLPLTVQVGDNPPADVSTPTVSTDNALYSEYGSDTAG